MSLVRFFSDPHFHHKSMAIKRGFTDEIEMNEHIISEWNRIVTKRDVTWILGDITMENSNYKILDRLNGIKKVVLGNHDEPKHISELLKHVNFVCGMYKFKDKINRNSIFLTHCPIHSSELDYRVKYNIHGHVHENTINDKRYINVSAEAIEYKPKLITEISWQ